MQPTPSVTVVRPPTILDRIRGRELTVQRYRLFAGVWIDESGRPAPQSVVRQLETAAVDDERTELLQDIAAACAALPTPSLELVLCAARTFDQQSTDFE